MPDNVDPQIRKTVSLPVSVWRLVEDFRWGERVKYESEALDRLIRRGLAATAQRAAQRLSPDASER
jgi:hypothetical protein